MCPRRLGKLTTTQKARRTMPSGDGIKELKKDAAEREDEGQTCSSRIELSTRALRRSENTIQTPPVSTHGQMHVSSARLSPSIASKSNASSARSSVSDESIPEDMTRGIADLGRWKGKQARDPTKIPRAQTAQPFPNSGNQKIEHELMQRPLGGFERDGEPYFCEHCGEFLCLQRTEGIPLARRTCKELSELHFARSPEKLVDCARTTSSHGVRAAQENGSRDTAEDDSKSSRRHGPLAQSEQSLGAASICESRSLRGSGIGPMNVKTVHSDDESDPDIVEYWIHNDLRSPSQRTDPVDSLSSSIPEVGDARSRPPPVPPLHFPPEPSSDSGSGIGPMKVEAVSSDSESDPEVVKHWVHNDVGPPSQRTGSVNSIGERNAGTDDARPGLPPVALLHAPPGSSNQARSEPGPS